MPLPEIIWFQNSHEQRNHLLLHGFMKLHKSGNIRFVYRPYAELEKYIQALKIRDHVHRHTSFFLFSAQGKQLRVLVDSEDSFAQLCPLIEEVDVYFAAAYNSRIYRDKQFLEPYPWQTKADVEPYEKRAEELIGLYGEHFHKIRKFVPIGPNSHHSSSVAPLQQKVLNAKDKLWKGLWKEIYWEPLFQMFEARYRHLDSLRNAPLQYDVVLNDTLWGWPVHRYKLHQELKRLSATHSIHSILKWHDSGEQNPLNPEEFPILTRPITGNYEQMMASSRLAVFATGYHWGWRNIMTLALYWGLPVLMDEPVFEPYFEMKEFRYFTHRTGEWKEIGQILETTLEQEWQKIKIENQATYDRLMRPEKVAAYVLKTLHETA
jgi:hypothetical protein